ncbi:MAG: hypothetical protein AB7E08_05735 [Candidatus Omnitrophota bacterium]
MRVYVTKCDGCGKELNRTSEIYKLYLKTDRFWDGVDNDCLTVNLDFCKYCAMTIKDTLTKIVKKLEGGGSDG